jgi:hypothetical protein
MIVCMSNNGFDIIRTPGPHLTFATILFHSTVIFAKETGNDPPDIQPEPKPKGIPGQLMCLSAAFRFCFVCIESLTEKEPGGKDNPLRLSIILTWLTLSLLV